VPANTYGDVFNLPLEDLALGFGAQLSSNVVGDITGSKCLRLTKTLISITEWSTSFWVVTKAV
jgi:hypothetical protein